PADSGLEIGTISTAWLPGSVFAAPSGTAPAGPITETLENFGSPPSLNSSRISLSPATVPPTAGVAFSSWACARAAVDAQANASAAAKLTNMRVIIDLL